MHCMQCFENFDFGFQHEVEAVVYLGEAPKYLELAVVYLKRS